MSPAQNSERPRPRRLHLFLVAIFSTVEDGDTFTHSYSCECLPVPLRCDPVWPNRGEYYATVREADAKRWGWL